MTAHDGHLSWYLQLEGLIHCHAILSIEGTGLAKLLLNYRSVVADRLSWERLKIPLSLCITPPPTPPMELPYSPPNRYHNLPWTTLRKISIHYGKLRNSWRINSQNHWGCHTGYDVPIRWAMPRQRLLKNALFTLEDDDSCLGYWLSSSEVQNTTFWSKATLNDEEWMTYLKKCRLSKSGGSRNRK